MSNTPPVVKELSSDATQAMSAAISSTVTKRPRGIFDSVGMRGADPLDDGVALVGHRAGDRATGHEEDVRPRNIGERVLDLEAEQTFVVGEDPCAFGAEHQFGVGHELEHLIGAHGIERCELRVEADGDLHH
jgi:hypothetical protein